MYVEYILSEARAAEPARASLVLQYAQPRTRYRFPMSYLASLWTQLIAWVSNHFVEPAVVFLHIADTAGNPLEISRRC